MNIVDDHLVFDLDSDILRFTPTAQEALKLYTGPNLPPETTPINAFNAIVDAAIIALKKTGVEDVAPLGAALATEQDPAKVAQAQALIDQAEAILGVGAAAAPEAIKSK